jgi:parvulin-like peptidyl-prolyl isomerase
VTRTSRRPARRSTAARLALAGLAALVLTGCGTNQVRTGAAAIVGDERISAEELQVLVDRGLTDPRAQEARGDRAAYQRSVLTRLINAEILQHAADEPGRTGPDGGVDEALRFYVASTPKGTLAELEETAAQEGIAPSDLRAFVRNIALDQALGDKLTEDIPVPTSALQELYDQNPAFDKVRSSHIHVPTRKQADELLARVKADPTSLPALAKQFSTDPSAKDTGGDLGLQPRGQFVQEFDQAVFAAKEGDLLIVQTQFGFHLVKVVDRVTVTLQEAVPQLRRTALQAERDEAKSVALREAAKELGIRVSPRFGTWSDEAGEVVERESELSTPAPGSDGGGLDGGPEAPGGEVPGGGAPGDGGAPADGGAEAPAGSPPGQ